MQGLKTVWFKFVQPQGYTTAQISTCTSNSPAKDSLLQVFKPGDNSSPQNACRTLSVIGCNDDAPGCSSGGRNSKLCVADLNPGETYYIMLGTKTADLTVGEYRVNVSAGCTGGDATANDYCPNAMGVSESVTPFSINVPIKECKGGTNDGKPCVNTSPDCPNGSCLINPHTVTFDCPAEPNLPNGLNDVWYNYTATCTGQAHITTCGGSNPDTTLSVYADCTKCPPASGNPIAWNDNLYGNCGSSSGVTVPVTTGDCLKVRVTDNQGLPVSGNLTITCSAGCLGPGFPSDPEVIANCPPVTGPPDCQDCNHNGRPDVCDIRDALETDCNNNRIPDSCETLPDCQPNFIPDVCDILNCHGEPFCVDVNPHNGIPDICESLCSSVTSVNPTNCAIDARQPFPPNTPGTPQGWNSVEMTFNAGCVASNLTPGDFTVTCTSAPCPTISGVAGVGSTATVTLSSVIPVGKWTCVKHTVSGAQTCLGNLPGDANGDRTAAPGDILEIIDNLNLTRVPPLLPYQCDLDRSAVCAPADILTEIDLLNGANGWPVQNGQTLLVCPSP